MKFIKTIQFILLVFCCTFVTDAMAQKTIKYPPNTSPIKRNVIFTHGLGGNANAWNVYANYFSTTKHMNSYRPQYSMSNVPAMANQLKSSMIGLMGSSVNKNNNIYVGHSLAGMVGRQLYKDNQGYFKYMVTSGSQHLGAPIAKAALDGEINDYINNGCNELGAGPASSIVGQLATLFSGYTLSEACDKAEEAAQGSVGAVFSPPTLVDIAPNSAFMSGGILNSTTPTPPNKIACYGVEDSPVNWRQFTSIAINKPGTLPMNQTKDHTLVNVMSGVRAFWWGRVVHHAMKASQFDFWPMHWLSAIHENKSNQWNRGVNWIDISETQWKKIIGALSQQTTTVTLPNQFLCDAELDQLYFQLDLIEQHNGPGGPAMAAIFQAINNLQNDPNCWGTQTTTTTQWVEQDSDGVVPISSQKWNAASKNLKILGANHQEERNHPNATSVYSDIFNGTHGYGFKVIDSL